MLPMVDETDGKYDGFAFVVLDAIRDQLKSAPENKADDIYLSTRSYITDDSAIPPKWRSHE